MYPDSGKSYRPTLPELADHSHPPSQLTAGDSGHIVLNPDSPQDIEAFQVTCVPGTGAYTLEGGYKRNLPTGTWIEIVCTEFYPDGSTNLGWLVKAIDGQYFIPDEQVGNIAGVVLIRN